MAAAHTLLAPGPIGALRGVANTVQGGVFWVVCLSYSVRVWKMPFISFITNQNSVTNLILVAIL